MIAIKFDERAFRIIFYACYLALAFAISCVILSALTLDGSLGNVNEFHVSGSGDIQVRNDMESSSDFASAEQTDIDYDSVYTWGVDGQPTTFETSFLLASASTDGKWKNSYRVKGSGADHKVSFTATKISGNASFAATITLDANEAGGQNFDSVIEFDTRDGSATIEGRVYNQTAGRPATVSELSAVGSYLLEHHLNVSSEGYTPENWLGNCGDIDQDMILAEDTKGIWIAPLNTSTYNYVYDPKTKSITPIINTTSEY